MIGWLRGYLLERSPNQLLVDVGGVGYQVNISLATYSRIEATGDSGAEVLVDPGALIEVRLHIHTHVWSDGLALYGFWTPAEKSLFEKLIAVSGIGPKLAQVILSGMEAKDLVSALASGDVGGLTTIPGVGKKTAERMVVELRDKVDTIGLDIPAPLPEASEDLVSALVNLGYKKNAAERAVSEARRDSPDAELQDLLRSSLRRLSRV